MHGKDMEGKVNKNQWGKLIDKCETEEDKTLKIKQEVTEKRKQ